VKRITIEETLALADYERVRPVLRPLFMHEKDHRRLAVGSHLTLLFESLQTVWYQVQEMIRAEQMTAREAIQHELDTYNELLPANGELSATLTIEYGDSGERDAALRRLVGLEKHLWLAIGTRRAAAVFDTRQMDAERMSSVQFIRFKLEAIAPEKFLVLARDGKVAIEVDHSSLAARAPIEGDLARALLADLA
jgi:hypothetical protein